MAELANVFQELVGQYLAGELPPVTLRTVAERAGCSIATVSRYAATRSFDTPEGALPYKALFNSALRTAEGEGDVGSHHVKALIASMVEQARPNHLSDQAVTDRLLEQYGIRCARRTVNKYRSGG